MRKASILILLAALSAPALPQQTFEVEPICEGPVLKGLRGRIPSAGRFTIYLPPDLCTSARPVSRTT
jgi:hypothetical protein